jgi:SHS2 domain-containing protein
MIAHTSSGYQERPHTADWALDVWAPDLIELLRAAAQGMYALIGARPEPNPDRKDYKIEFAVRDEETLLVSFLSELIYFTGRDNVAFDEFDLTLDGAKLLANVSGLPIESQAKEIKAVTFHNLSIRRTERGLETTIVFDV